MNLNKKLIAGAMIATLALSSGMASAEERHGRGHGHGHSHGHRHGDDAGKIAGVILGAAIIGSIIAHSNSQAQAQPSYVPADSYAPPAATTYSYGAPPPVIYRSAPTVYVESPRYYSHYGHSHHRHHRHHHRHHGGWRH